MGAAAWAANGLLGRFLPSKLTTLIAIAIGAFVTVYWRKAKKKVQDALHIDDNAKKTMEDELIVTDDVKTDSDKK